LQHSCAISGGSIVLLSGLGDTAHLFPDPASASSGLSFLALCGTLLLERLRRLFLLLFLSV
jgi:hypothetical protein